MIWTLFVMGNNLDPEDEDDGPIIPPSWMN
jgi:hypothetical protein